jgi:hypothetical protein
MHIYKSIFTKEKRQPLLLHFFVHQVPHQRFHVANDEVATYLTAATQDFQEERANRHLARLDFRCFMRRRFEQTSKDQLQGDDTETEPVVRRTHRTRRSNLVRVFVIGEIQVLALRHGRPEIDQFRQDRASLQRQINQRSWRNGQHDVSSANVAVRHALLVNGRQGRGNVVQDGDLK